MHKTTEEKDNRLKQQASMGKGKLHFTPRVTPLEQAKCFTKAINKKLVNLNQETTVNIKYFNPA